MLKIIKFIKSIILLEKQIALAVNRCAHIFYETIERRCANWHKLICSLCKKILYTVYTAKFRFIVFLYIIFFLIGRCIALKEDFNCSLIHQINLTVISLIGLYMLQYLHRIIENTRAIMLGVCPYISEPLAKLKEARFSPLNLLLPLFPVIFFINKIIRLNYVPVSFTGIYAIIMAASAFYIALVCYWQLILSTRTIYRLTHIEYKNLPFAFPNDLFEVPSWIKNLIDIYKKTQFSFFTVGILFTAEYLMLMPSNIKIIDSNGNLNKNLSFEFWSTWIVIFVFIIIAFPIFWIILKRLFTILAKNLNKKVLSEMSIFNTAPMNDLTSIWSYYQLVNNAIKFENKLFSRYNFYPFIATSVSFILNLAKLYELLKLPLLRSTI